MFEFKWHVPGPTPSEVMLRIHSRSGWLGRKVLICDGHTVFDRSWRAGIDAQFAPPGADRPLNLRAVRVPNSADWRPVLFLDGAELPETTGTTPPQIVPAPKSLALPVGLTYLIMAIVAAMLPQTSTILDAFYIRGDDRKAVLDVADPQAAAPTLAVDSSALVPATAGQSYVATLKPIGGTPPYTWAQIRDGWPRGWKLDPATGAFSGKPGAAHDVIARIKLTDAAGKHVDWPIALQVLRAKSPGPDWPVITTIQLPAATLGQPYEFTIGRTGGQPPFFWRTVGKRRLPDGLELDPDNGTIRGTPERAGQFPVTIRVVDDQYASSRDIGRWIAPFVVTALCMLGFLSMRKWSVYVFACLIVVQIVGAFVLALPISHTALGLQAVLCALGAAHLGKMR